MTWVCDAGLVHVGQPRVDVGDFAASALDVGSIGFAFRRGRGDDAKAAFARGFRKDVAVDQPQNVEIAVERVVRHRHHDRAAMVHALDR